MKGPLSHCQTKAAQVGLCWMLATEIRIWNRGPQLGLECGWFQPHGKRQLFAKWKKKKKVTLKESEFKELKNMMNDDHS